MAAYIPRLSGGEWQEWANQLLACHYGPGNYQTIPDKDRGDAGLEGFCPGLGHAYQAYGCEEPLSVQERFQKQRDKLTEDVRKFIDNAAILTKLLRHVKIKRWILLVPLFDSKELVAHAAKKTGEIIAAGLPYVDPDFRVMVCQEADFPVARDLLLGANTKGIKFEVEPVTLTELGAWASTNDAMLSTLQRKLAKLPMLSGEAQRNAFMHKVLTWYLEGQAVLDRLRGYPHVYEKVIAAKSHRENFLVMIALQGSTSSEILVGALQELRVTLESEAKELHNFSAEKLAYEALADWLIRCPLDFPEVANG